MALLNELDVTSTESALRAWISDRVPDATDVIISNLDIPHSAGMSMTTVLFDASWTEAAGPETRRLVARVAPSGPGIFKEPNLRKEFRLLQALSDTVVPVPAPHWLEENPSVLGSPFMVVERVDGRVPSDDPPYTVEGWVMDLSPERRGTLFDGALQEIARIHSLDWQPLGLLEVLDEAQFGPTGIAQQLRHWEESYEWAASAGQRSQTIEDAFAWLRTNVPADGELVLNWGDARIGNLIFADDLSVRAVLDWEMATIGDPQVDLGWTVFITRYMTEGVGAAMPAGMPDRDAIIARYEELTGRASPDIHFYEVFSALKLSIIYVRAGSLLIAAGNLPVDSTMGVNNPGSQILAKLLGLPAPAGASVNYVGNR